MLLFKYIASVVVFSSLGVKATPTPTYPPDIDVRHVRLDPRQDATTAIGLPASLSSSSSSSSSAPDPGPTDPVPCDYADGIPGELDDGQCWPSSTVDTGMPCTLTNGSVGTIIRQGDDSMICWLDPECVLSDGRVGTWSPNRDVCEDPDSPPTTNCTLQDGRPGKLSNDGETCEDPNPPISCTDCTNCTLPDGRQGKLSDDGKTCEDLDPPSPTNCTLPDGRPGKLGADGKTCEDPGCTVDGKSGKMYGTPGTCMLEDCTLQDGTKGKRNADGICISTAEPEDECKKLGGKMENGKCVLPGDNCDRNGTKGILDDDLKTCIQLPTGPCVTANGKKGTYNADGLCVANPEPPDVGTICTTTDNKPGKIDENHQCDPDVVTAPTTPPKTSTICTSGGEQGVIDKDGKCVVTQRPNGTPVFPPNTPGAPQVDATSQTGSSGGVKPWVIGAAAAGGVVVLVAAAAATVGCQYEWDHDRRKLRRRKKKRRRRRDDEYDPNYEVNKPFAPQPVAQVPYMPYTYGTPSGPGPAVTAYQPVYPQGPPPPQGYAYER